MKVLIFGGTTEGKNLANELSKQGIQTVLSVATEYGKSVAVTEQYEVTACRLSAEEMKQYISEHHFDCVVDATHPYANVVTENIQTACDVTQVKYIRLVRAESDKQLYVTYVENYDEVCELLGQNTDNILLTVGSKELHHFTRIKDFDKRCFVRMIPMMDSLQKAMDLGFSSSRVICMQGPFDVEMNKATLKLTKAKFLVTKDSGDVGGFLAKVEAASDLGISVIVVSRPVKEVGFTYDQILDFFQVPKKAEKFPLFIDLSGRKILVVGGGAIAERRIKQLVRFGAEITVVSKSATDTIDAMASEGKITFHNREYNETDIKEWMPFLVIAATNDRSVNKKMQEEAKRLNILHIISDNKEDCDCYFPAIAESESMIVGLTSKDGNHRAVADMAKQLRSFLNGKKED